MRGEGDGHVGAARGARGRGEGGRLCVEVLGGGWGHGGVGGGGGEDQAAIDGNSNDGLVYAS
jgi:hypothetical protein